jgi:hypothetical protein
MSAGRSAVVGRRRRVMGRASMTKTLRPRSGSLVSDATASSTRSACQGRGAATMGSSVTERASTLAGPQDRSLTRPRVDRILPPLARALLSETEDRAPRRGSSKSLISVVQKRLTLLGPLRRVRARTVLPDGNPRIQRPRAHAACHSSARPGARAHKTLCWLSRRPLRQAHAPPAVTGEQRPRSRFHPIDGPAVRLSRRFIVQTQSTGLIRGGR